MLIQTRISCAVSADRQKEIVETSPEFLFESSLRLDEDIGSRNSTLSISSASMRRQECAWLQLLWKDNRPRGEPEKPQIFLAQLILTWQPNPQA